MSIILNENHSDICNLELKLYQKLIQLQSKEDALQQSQIKLTSSENFIYKLQILLETERQTLNKIRSELKLAVELIKQLEDEKINDKNRQVQLEIDWQNAQIIHNTLLTQVKKIKLDNILLQRNNEMLEANILEQKILNHFITESIKDLRNQLNHLYPDIQSNIEKLKQEHKYLCNSFQTISKLNFEIDYLTKIKLKTSPNTATMKK